MKHLGARRTAPPHKRAARFFPVRLRLVVPPFGFGMKLAEMAYWLDRSAGRGNYFMGGGSTFGEVGKPYVDCADYYFVDLKTVQAFVDRFSDCVQLAIGPESDRPNDN